MREKGKAHATRSAQSHPPPETRFSRISRGIAVFSGEFSHRAILQTARATRAARTKESATRGAWRDVAAAARRGAPVLRRASS
jgi:hypothetical protein